MHYFMLFVWLMGLLLGGMGLYRVWTRWLSPAGVDWLLFPVTLAGEGAYIVGRKMCHRPAFGGLIGPRRANEDACRYAISGHNGFWIELFSQVLLLAATGAGLTALFYFLGGGITGGLTPAVNSVRGLQAELPTTIPGTLSEFWKFLHTQLTMARQVSTVWADLDWTQWQTPALVYGSICFTVRLGPVRHDQRPLLILVALLVGGCALAGGAIPTFKS